MKPKSPFYLHETKLTWCLPGFMYCGACHDAQKETSFIRANCADSLKCRPVASGCCLQCGISTSDLTGQLARIERAISTLYDQWVRSLKLIETTRGGNTIEPGSEAFWKWVAEGMPHSKLCHCQRCKDRNENQEVL